MRRACKGSEACVSKALFIQVIFVPWLVACACAYDALRPRAVDAIHGAIIGIFWQLF